MTCGATPGTCTSAAECSGKCPALVISNADIVGACSAAYGTSCTVQCQTGYVMNGSATITCQSSGRWTLRPVRIYKLSVGNDHRHACCMIVKHLQLSEIHQDNAHLVSTHTVYVMMYCTFDISKHASTHVWLGSHCTEFQTLHVV